MSVVKKYIRTITEEVQVLRINHWADLDYLKTWVSSIDPEVHVSVNHPWPEEKNKHIKQSYALLSTGYPWHTNMTIRAGNYVAYYPNYDQWTIIGESQLEEMEENDNKV